MSAGTVNSMMEEIHIRFEQRPAKPTKKGEKSDDVPKDPEGTAIDLTKQAAKDSIELDEEPFTESDIQRNTMEEEQRVSALADSLVESEGYTKEQAEEKAKAIHTQRRLVHYFTKPTGRVSHFQRKGSGWST